MFLPLVDLSHCLITKRSLLSQVNHQTTRNPTYAAITQLQQLYHHSLCASVSRLHARLPTYPLPISG
ncbi:MAG: hypothetical protein LDL41_05725 [Coleofasciculus sp. S288]|nr:hypothetical protein [Coleofasciculus sp. S288]